MKRDAGANTEVWNAPGWYQFSRSVFKYLRKDRSEPQCRALLDHC